MNGKPENTEMEVRNGLHRKGQIGRESGWLHSLLLNLRAAGATPEDLAYLQEEADFKFYEFMVAAMRGLVKPELPSNLINLARTPNFSPDRGESKIIVDQRLGIHLCMLLEDRIKVGKKRLAIREASGIPFISLSNSQTFDRGNVFPLPIGPIFDLNARGAVELVQRYPEEIYRMMAKEEATEVLCLGTVWQEVEKREVAVGSPSTFSVMAITLADGMPVCKITPIQYGGESRKFHIAVLE